MAIITSYSDDATTVDDDKFLTSSSDGVTRLTPASNINKYVGPGWTIAGDSWSYSSYSSTTNLGVINTNAGANTRYSIGMKVKFSQPTLGVKYGFISSVASSSITVSFVGNTVLSNEAITLPFYSTAYAPNQYPLDSPVISTGYSDLSNVPNSVVYNGNRSYTLTFNSLNLATVLSPGFRSRTIRTTPAPTQSTSLNGTNQYWNNTSPNKMTFTDDFVVSAWIKISSYGNASIVSRFNGTSGWDFRLTSTGQVQMSGFNGSSANESLVLSYQTVPLNKWVHVVGQLDMSSFTTTATTSYIMFDGIDVPCSVLRSGTNPTSLIQAGNFEVGSRNGGTLPFPGKIAQAAVFNAKVTQATMQGYISQGLTGTETSLASAYSFNGVTTDLNTTTPNNLTAQGSATATNADSPFGGQASGLISSTLDYGIVQSVTFSTNSTVVVQVPEGCTIPTNSGGISAVSYSSAKAPYGFPGSIDKWCVIMYDAIHHQVGSTVGTFNPDGMRISIPTGNWKINNQFTMYVNKSGSGSADDRFKLGTSPTTGEVIGSSVTIYDGLNVAGDLMKPASRTVYFSASTQTILYYQIQVVTLTSVAGYRGDFSATYTIAENAYL